MKTITPWVVMQYIKRYGPLWTAGFLSRYALAGSNLEFRVPGYGKQTFHARMGTSDVRVFNQVVLRRSYELPFRLDNVRHIVDAGANAGFATKYFGRHYPGATIVAIEPDSSNVEILRRNIAEIPGAEAFKGALWHTKTKLSIQNPNAPKTAIIVGEAGVPDVDTVTVPELVRKHGRIDILKIDIETAELELFSAPDVSWLKDVRCLIVELHDFMRKGCSMALYGALAGRKFEQHISGENLIILLDS